MEQQRKKRHFLATRTGMVLLGILLGLAARYSLGGPAEDPGLKREFNQPLTPVDHSDIQLLPSLDVSDEDDDQGRIESGLVPPILLPGELPMHGQQSPEQVASNFAHEPNAHFHAHGDKVCASGCAASSHPTEKLTRERFEQLLVELTYEPMNRTNNALEALLYYGPQTKAMIRKHGVGELDSERAEFVWKQLETTHARISIRVVDQHGEVRTWIKPTLVPFDRRHVFDMKTKDLQPLVTSGTVKRVGLDHLWTRL